MYTQYLHIHPYISNLPEAVHFSFGKVTALGVLCCFALDLACFFLPSFFISHKLVHGTFIFTATMPFTHVHRGYNVCLDMHNYSPPPLSLSLPPSLGFPSLSTKLKAISTHLVSEPLEETSTQKLPSAASMVRREGEGGGGGGGRKKQ